MKNSHFPVFVFLLLVAAINAPHAQVAYVQETTERAASIDAVLAEVQAGIDIAQDRLATANICSGSCPHLKEVTVSLEAVLKKVENVGFKFLIFSFGKKIEDAQAQKIQLNLKPPPPVSGQSLTKESLSSILADAIVDAVNGVQRAENDKKFPLRLETFEVELSFVVLVEDSGGVNAPKISILPIDIDFGAAKQLSKTNTHKVKVVFER